MLCASDALKLPAGLREAADELVRTCTSLELVYEAAPSTARGRLSLVGLSTPVYWPRATSPSGSSADPTAAAAGEATLNACAETLALLILCQAEQAATAVLFNAYSIHAFHVADAVRPAAYPILVSPGWLPGFSPERCANPSARNRSALSRDLCHKLASQSAPLWNLRDIDGGWMVRPSRCIDHTRSFNSHAVLTL
jgi:hypothetical protein